MRKLILFTIISICLLLFISNKAAHLFAATIYTCDINKSNHFRPAYNGSSYCPSDQACPFGKSNPDTPPCLPKGTYLCDDPASNHFFPPNGSNSNCTKDQDCPYNNTQAGSPPCVSKGNTSKVTYKCDIPNSNHFSPPDSKGNSYCDAKLDCPYLYENKGSPLCVTQGDTSKTTFLCDQQGTNHFVPDYKGNSSCADIEDCPAGATKIGSPPCVIHKSGAEGNPKCKCASPNSMHGGANGFDCSADSGVSNPPPKCLPDHFCEDTPSGPECKLGGDNIAGYCISLNDACTGVGSNLGGKCCGDNTECAGSGPVGLDQGTCKIKTSGSSGGGSPIPSAPPPPCAQLIDKNGADATNNTAIAVGCSSVNTGFGVWETDPSKFVTKIFDILLSIAGAIAVLIIMFAGYRFIASQGDPEKIQGAQEQITAAIVGLLFIIFSFVILQVIGVDLLHLPGFGGGNSVGTGNGGGNGGNGGNQTDCQTAGDVCVPSNLVAQNGGKCFNGQSTLPFTCTTAGTVCCRPGPAFPGGSGGNQCGGCKGQTCNHPGQYCEETLGNNQFGIYLCDQLKGTWQYQYNNTGSQTCH